jgi:peptidoglycan-associated lipoprotein
MIAQRRLAVVTLTVAVAVAAACAKKPEPAVVQPVQQPVTQGPNQDSIRAANIARIRQDSIDRAQALQRADAQRRADSIAAANAAAAAAARDAENMRNTIATRVHYDYDKADLRDDTKQALDAKIPILTANPGLMIRVAGHTDNRGSGEYNLQLGQRRAAAARDYLTARGVAANRIELVSYGEERPVCQMDDESCWSQNRRAEFEITAGGNMLRRP